MDGEPPSSQQSAPEAAGHVELHRPPYLGLLLLAALLGIPLSLLAFGFLVGVHQLEHVVWSSLPSALGYADVPAWWPVVTIALAGVLVALIVTHLPGQGGHVPVAGHGAGATAPHDLPGVLLAAAASLVLGAVVGPEAPLIALGSGFALLAISRTRAATNQEVATVVAAAGSATAISAIFGNPLVAAVIFLEVLGLARRKMMLVVLPCLLASGVGAVAFTGLGSWTGLDIGALAVPDLEPVRLAAGDVAWAVPLAAVAAVGSAAVFAVGRRAARLARSHVLATTVGAGVLAGCCAGAYALLTGHSPTEVALSGQATLPVLAAHPEEWSTGALVALLVLKAVAYALCLGVFRGGAVFPAVFVGAAFGALAAAVLPGLGFLPGLAIGMAGGVAVIGLPVTGALLVVLLLGDAAASQIPVVIIAVVVATVVREAVSPDEEAPPEST